MPKPSLIQTLIGALASDIVACLVAFGAPLNQTQQVTVLSVIGTLTSVAVLIVGLVHAKHIEHVQSAAPSPPVGGK